MFAYVCLALFVATCYAQNIDNAPPQPPSALPFAVGNTACRSRNGYFKIEGSCDSYIECREFLASNITCPDGLHFDVNAQWPAYPCGYPADVPCLNRGAQQLAEPTADCPHQYGYYPSAKSSPAHCDLYKTCVAGVAFEMHCPMGLAFNPVMGRCDWPDLVPGCDVNAFLGFKCPPAPLGADGQPLDIVQNYRKADDCFSFFTCEKGRARLLSCDEGLAFDLDSGRCIDADHVQCAMPAPRALKA